MEECLKLYIYNEFFEEKMKEMINESFFKPKPRKFLEKHMGNEGFSLCYKNFELYDDDWPDTICDIIPENNSDISGILLELIVDSCGAAGMNSEKQAQLKKVLFSDEMEAGYKYVYYKFAYEDVTEYSFGVVTTKQGTGNKYKNVERNLSEIFPGLDETIPNGIQVVDGGFWSTNGDYLKYLGRSDYDYVYLPPNISSINKDTNWFNSPNWVIDKMVITTNMKSLTTHGFYMHGFKEFYIVDAKTGDVVFYNDRFNVPEEKMLFVGMEDEFENFCEVFNENPEKAIDSPEFNILRTINN